MRHSCYDDAAEIEMETEVTNNNEADAVNDVEININVDTDSDASSEASAGAVATGAGGSWDDGSNGNGEKVIICHKGQTKEVAPAAVPAHLAHGDTLGACPDPVVEVAAPESVVAESTDTDSEISEKSMVEDTTGHDSEEIPTEPAP